MLTKQRAAVRELTVALDESSTELRSTLDSLRECRAQLEEATVIMEFAPGREMQLLGGWLDLRPGEDAPAFGAHGARWYIPARMKPVFYEDAKGAAYYFYERQRRQAEWPVRAGGASLILSVPQ